jgi:hypothetical protein
MSKNKICPHPTTVQSGTETEIRTYCTVCNELIDVGKPKKKKDNGK